MDLYQHTDYKTIIRSRVQELKKTKPSLSLRALAEKIPVQYTYLSKTLNEDKAHLNEDHLFILANLLEFLPEEVDYLLLCRSHDISTETSRKKYLFSKIEKIKKEKKLSVPVIDPSTAHLIREMAYMFDPLCLVFHMALEIPSVQKNPEILCSKFGITRKHLKEILKKLARNDFIEWDETHLTVTKVNPAKMHFGRDHALTRIHQNLIKTAINSQLMKVSEEEKHSFLATFNGDKETYEKIKDEFQDFLKKVEKIASKSRSDHVFQLNFDLFPWV